MSKTERKCGIHLENFEWSSDVTVLLEMRAETFQEWGNEDTRNVTKKKKNPIKQN